MKRGWKINAPIGALLAVAVFIAWYLSIHAWREWQPGTDWLEVTRFTIADAEIGHDPRINYDRIIKQDVPGRWAVNVYKHKDKDDTLGTIKCTGSGLASYKAGRPLPPDAITLSWLLGTQCFLSKGTYSAVATFILTPEGYPTKVVEKTSNYFVVPPQEEETP